MITTSFMEFHESSRIISGAGTRSQLPDYIKQLGGKHVVLFSDKGLTSLGITQQISDAISASSEIELVGIFDDITQDAKSSNINAAVKYFKEVDGDIVIAVGGGSVIDTVKAVKFCIENNIKNIEHTVTDNTYVVADRAKPFKIPHITLPTTAGTGSEVSKGAVVFNELLGYKCSISHPYLSSNIAILDPDLTVNLPPMLTSSTGMDALTHAIEAFFAKETHNYSDAFATHAIKTILANIEQATHNGKKNLVARAHMMQASSMAISSFLNVFGPFPVHNVAHALGAKYHIPHGLANSVLLPLVMKHLPELYINRITEFATLLNVNIDGLDTNQILEVCVQEITALAERLDLPQTFASYNIDLNDMEQIIVAVLSDPIGMMYQIPVEAIQKIVTDAAGVLNTVEN